MVDPEAPAQREEQGQEKWYGRMRYQILLFIGGIALFVLVGGWILDWYIAPQTSSQKKDLVQALGLITAGVAGAVGIYFTWRGQSQARRAQEENQRSTQEQISLTRQSQRQDQQATQAQLENAQEELRLTRQGQITERFTRAIDQLGNASLEIRLGGIYALERIARESEEDHWPIMEVLTAYVRQHAPWPPEEEREGTEAAAAENAPDIQAIITVISRRERDPGHGEPEPLHLHETNLRNANLGRVNLSGVILSGANLFGAALWRADLSGADLKEADLSQANLRKANLSGARLALAKLSGAKPWEANLSGADLWGADLSGAQLLRADLSGASLWGAKLSEAVLLGADLSGADLRGADLRGADLRATTGLTDNQLKQARGNENSQLPDDLEPPEEWGAQSDEQTEED